VSGGYRDWHGGPGYDGPQAGSPAYGGPGGYGPPRSRGPRDYGPRDYGPRDYGERDYVPWGYGEPDYGERGYGPRDYGERGPGAGEPGAWGPGEGEHGERDRLPRPDPRWRRVGDGSFLPGFGYGQDRGPDRGRGPGGRDDRDDRDGYDDGDPGEYYDYYEDYERQDEAAAPGPKRGRARRLAPWIALAVIVAVIGVPAYYVYSLYMAKYHPPDYSGPGTAPVVDVTVTQGATASSLAPTLVSDGVVASSRAFVLAAEHSADSTGLEPGTYKLNTHMQASLAYAALLNPGNRVQLTITIPEGKRVAQVIAILAADMHVPVSQFEQIVDNPPPSLGLPSYAKTSVPGFHGIGYQVEGYLWPATYEIQPHETPLQVLQAMVAKFSQVSQQDNLPAAASRRGLSMEQLMIEASIVQAEAGRASQMPKIARVIENRLDAPMALQFDSVLEYGLDRFAVNIQNSWAQIPGPYNDFLNRGLPPTPISDPGMAAIDAVLHPASGNWLYFLAYPDGTSVFCATPPSGLSCPNP
jgi:UPF0755 protein